MQYAFLWLLQCKLFTTELGHANSANKIDCRCTCEGFVPLIVRTFVVHLQSLLDIATAQFIRTILRIANINKKYSRLLRLSNVIITSYYRQLLSAR